MRMTGAGCCPLSAGIIEGPYAFSIITLLLNFVLFLLSTVLLARYVWVLVHGLQCDVHAKLPLKQAAACSEMFEMPIPHTHVGTY